MKKMLLIAFGWLLMTGSATADTVVYSGNLVDETSLGADTNYDLDLQARGIDSVTAVVTASSATISAVGFNAGRASTGSFTVVSLTDLTTAYATNRLTVLSTSSLTGSQIRLSGIPITEGLDWNVGATKALTALSIAAALNTKFSGIIVSTAPAGSAVVYSTSATTGYASNEYTFTSSVSSITVLTPTFTGGRDNAWIQIGDTRLTFNEDIGVGGTTAATASNMATAITASSVTSRVIGHASGSVVTATSTFVGTGANFGLVSSTPSRVSTSGRAMTGGLDASFTISDDEITASSHGLSTGLGVYLSVVTGTAPAPLASGSTYYAIRVDADTLSLATSQANALAGTAITFTSSSTATTTPSYTLRVPTIAGSPAYKWRVSNDNTYWVDLSTSTTGTGLHVDQPTIAYVFGGSSRGFSFRNLGYRYLRFAVTAPTAGAVWIKNAVVGTKE